VDQSGHELRRIESPRVAAKGKKGDGLASQSVTWGGVLGGEHLPFNLKSSAREKTSDQRQLPSRKVLNDLRGAVWVEDGVRL